MNRTLRIYVLTVGIPALLLACAGVRLVQIEARRPRHRMVREFRDGRDMRDDREACDGCRPRPCPPRGIPRVFRDDADGESLERERMAWIGGCVVGLLFLSLVSGAWLLVRSERKAREDAMRKTDFLPNVSHEFKTPLTTICLCAELAQDDGMDPSRRMKALQSIVAEANRLKALVLQALDFSRLEKNRRRFELVGCDLADLAREASEPLRERFPEGGLSVSGCASAPAMADASAVRQIVVALLDNAAKYAANGGPVEVSSGVSVAGRPFISVADRGPGLPADAMRRVFDRFWRGDDATTAETGGSGLGLAIARELAHGMKGELEVARRDGGGLVFTFTARRAQGGQA